MRNLSLALLAVPVLLALGCEKVAEDPNKFATKAKCATDEDCAKGFICKEKACNTGQRTPAELAATKKAALEKKQAAEAAKKAIKPGEGRLVVRVCPTFKNTPEAIGTLIATHQKTKERHRIDMALRVADGDWASEFTFYSLPLGTYDVTASYGIQVGGRPDVHHLACHDSVAKKACRDTGKTGGVRIMEVVLPKDEPKPKMNKEGKPAMKACDWTAE